MEGRINAVDSLNRPQSLPLAIREVTITDSISGSRYSYLDWSESKRFNVPDQLDDLDSEEMQHVNELKALAAEEGKITSDTWRKAKNATGRAYYEELQGLLDECWAEYQALDYVMDDRYGSATPGLTPIKRTLEEVRSLVADILKEKPPAELPTGNQPGLPVDRPGQVIDNPPGGIDEYYGMNVGPIRSRQEALKQLGEVAAYFRRAEPHSPISYLVQRAIKWGQMPLDVWLTDVIKNDGVLEQLKETLGLNTTVSEDRDSD
jgi:type VI secretion system protein ImpA